MRIELNPRSQAKLEDILEELYVRYSMEELTPEELIDALLDIGIDLIVTEEGPVQLARERLIDLCSQKITSRVTG